MQEEKNEKLQELLNEINDQKRKTGIFTPPTSEQIEEYRRKQAELARIRAEQKREEERLLAEQAGQEKNVAPAEASDAPEAAEQIDRSFKELLRPSKVDEERENAGMLAPTIERGFETEPVVEPFAQKPEEEPEKRDVDHTDHPLFTTSRDVDIERIRREAEAREAREAAMAAHAQPKRETDGELLMSDEAKRRSTEGLLNVKEKVDDEFREFFGDTIIIEREPTSSLRRAKQRRIKDFVPATTTESAKIVFEDDEPEAETPDQNEGIEEYRSEEDTEPVLEQLMRLRASKTVVAAVNCVIAALIVALNALSAANVAFVSFITDDPVIFAAANGALALILFILNIKTIFSGISGMFTLKTKPGALAALSSLFMVAEPVANYFLARNAVLIAAPVGALALAFASIGAAAEARGVLQNFRAISSDFEKNVTFIPEEENASRRIARDSCHDEPIVLLKRKTGFSDNFMQNAFSPDMSGEMFRKLPVILLVAVIAAGAASYLRFKSIPDAFAAAALACALSSTLLSTLKSVLPLSKMQRSVARFGVVMPGYEAAQQTAEANSVVLDGREIFPKGSVLLHGIKTFEKERIDRAILYAASVIIPSCETLAPLFMNVIQGKTEMLYKTESISYEDKKGFSAWADGARVLIGNRDLMSSHEISLPSESYELRYTKTKARDAVYLAVNGKLYAMFVVSYTLSTEVEEALNKYVGADIAVLVRTNDFNMTAKRIAEIFSLPQAMVTVLRKTEMEYLSDKLSFKAHSPAVFNHIGTLMSYTTGIMACRRLTGCARAANILSLASVAIGAATGIALAVLGAVGSVSLLSVLAYHLVWLLIVTATACVAKY